MPLPWKYNVMCRDCGNKWEARSWKEILRCPKCGSFNVKMLPSEVYKPFIVPYVV